MVKAKYFLLFAIRHFDVSKITAGTGITHLTLADSTDCNLIVKGQQEKAPFAQSQQKCH